MTKHVKHEDSLDVQIRTKILDQYGNPIAGAIEYDPSTGFGKRVKDPALGLVEDFYCKDGSIEVDGHNFDDTNHDVDEVDGIGEMINLRVSRDTPEYEEMLKAKVNQKRDETKKRHDLSVASVAMAVASTTSTTSSTAASTTKLIATTQIAKGEEVIIDTNTGQVRGTRSDNIHRPDASIKRH